MSGSHQASVGGLQLLQLQSLRLWQWYGISNTAKACFDGIFAAYSARDGLLGPRDILEGPRAMGFNSASTLGCVCRQDACHLKLERTMANSVPKFWSFLMDATHSKQVHTAKACFDGIFAAYSARDGLLGPGSHQASVGGLQLLQLQSLRLWQWYGISKA
jgi:2-methylcitrate dehydratase PrpD